MDTRIDYCAVFYDDVYFAEVAAETLIAVNEHDDETLALVISCAAYNAECNLSRN